MLVILRKLETANYWILLIIDKSFLCGWRNRERMISHGPPIHTILENGQGICSHTSSLVAVGRLSASHRFLNRLIPCYTLKAARRESKSDPFAGDVNGSCERPDEQQNSPLKNPGFSSKS